MHPPPEADGAHDPAHALAEEILRARKYATLDPALVRAVVESELAKGRNAKAAVKAAKTKLHQMTRAYQAAPPDYAAWLHALAHAQDDAARRALCRQAMQSHASTRERLPIVHDFYGTLFVDLPAAPQVVDLACGLNPLALPWMPLPAGSRYWACDIDRAQIDFLNACLAPPSWPGGIPAQAAVHDLIHGDPSVIPPAHVTLLLKTIPCLEQLTPGIGASLLARLDTQVAFVSFPTRSLGGKNRGMAGHYADQFAQIAPPHYTVRRYEFVGELVFRLDRI